MRGFGGAGSLEPKDIGFGLAALVTLLGRRELKLELDDKDCPEPTALRATSGVVRADDGVTLFRAIRAGDWGALRELDVRSD